MLKFFGRSSKSLLAHAFLLMLMTGCAAVENTDPDEPDNTDFSGVWLIHEELTGCSANLTMEYEAEIIQNGATAQILIGEEMIECDVDGDELVCSGELQWNESLYRDFDEIIIWFDEEDQLAGRGTWIAHNADNGQCSGSSTFSTTEISPETRDFSGTWYMHEAWEGCSESGEMDYFVDIVQNNTEATLYLENQSLPCTVNGNELNCAGERHYESGAYDDYSAYILRFNSEGQLEGEASWIYYQPDMASCPGTSILSTHPFGTGADPEPVNFEGTYELFIHADDCNGVSVGEQASYFVIYQDETDATFSMVENETFSFDCQVIGPELQCEGKRFSYTETGDIWEITDLTLSFDSRNNLTGIANGVYYGEDGSECPGTYYFSPNSNSPDAPASFSGTWTVTEVMQGCQASITTEYPIEISQNDTDATLNIGGQIFDCAENDNELVCTGTLSGDNDAYLEYTEYRLWFNDENVLEGFANWSLYRASSLSCAGVSTLSAVPVVGDNRSPYNESEMELRRQLLFEGLQDGNGDMP